MPGIGQFLQGMFRPQPMAQTPGMEDPMAGMGAMDRMGYMRQNNPGALMGLAAGLMQGDMGKGFALAGASQQNYQDKFQERQDKLRTENMTKKYLLSQGMDPATVDAAVANPAILGSLLKPGAKDEFAERHSAGIANGLQGDELTSFTLTGQLPSGRFGSAETGLQTIPGVDDAGNFVLSQPTKSGKAVLTQFPENFHPMRPYDRSYETSSGQEAGKGQGEALTTYKSMSTKMPGLESVVKELDDLSDKATFTAAGQILDAGRRQANMEPREAAIARASYVAKVNNQILPMLRDTFGAQFTEREGVALRETLGDVNKSPKEKQAVLKAFIEQKRRDIEALAQQSGQAIEAPASGGGNADPLGIR